nr:SMI1/KNR4 family protein [Kofleriaceae bacterium]
MMSNTVELVEHVRRRLQGNDNACKISGPVDEAAIASAEEALGCAFPPSYRNFLSTFGGLTIPPHLGIVHDFVGLHTTGDVDDVVRRTLRAREERKLGTHLIIVAMGAQGQEWFCLDSGRATNAGEYPVVLFDARDNALDQQFYDDFDHMLSEVMSFVAENLEQPLD